MKVLIVGAGAWGTALAVHISQQAEVTVTLLARRATQAQAMQDTHENAAYLPGVSLPKSLIICANSKYMPPVYAGSLIIIASPLSALREQLQALASLAPQATVLLLCKGIEPRSMKLPHQIAAEFPQLRSATLSGPSFAQEVAAGLPCALTIAGDAQTIKLAQAALHHGALRVYASDDVIGVELGGAMKNVIAIAAGICDGMQLGTNARAALVTRGLAEIARLGAAMGAKPETLMGLAGLGDLVLTCTGPLSRNRRVGLELASGKPLPEIIANLGHVAEGVHAANAAVALAKQRGVDVPISEAVTQVLQGKATARDAIGQLLARPAKNE
jgi:glycerol-3-phosphate dehydrogenase (NAD(P)+)